MTRAAEAEEPQHLSAANTQMLPAGHLRENMTWGSLRAYFSIIGL